MAHPSAAANLALATLWPSWHPVRPGALGFSRTVTFTLHRVGNLDIPVPCTWTLQDNKRSFAGREGLVDPRLEAGAPIDANRVELIRERMPEAEVEMFTCGSFMCISCAYIRDRCTVLSYTVAAPPGEELRVVYVLNHGQEALSRLIHEFWKGSPSRSIPGGTLGGPIIPATENS